MLAGLGCGGEGSGGLVELFGGVIGGGDLVIEFLPRLWVARGLRKRFLDTKLHCLPSWNAVAGWFNSFCTKNTLTMWFVCFMYGRPSSATKGKR